MEPHRKGCKNQSESANARGSAKRIGVRKDTVAGAEALKGSWKLSQNEGSNFDV